MSVQQWDRGGSGPAGTERPPEIRLSVSQDSMTATVWVVPAFEGQEVPADRILSMLSKSKIVYGVDKAGIHEFCKSGKFDGDLVCAHGLPPVDEENGRLEFLFERDKSVMPAQREDGTVDYRDLGIVQNAKRGDVLCRAVPPKPGRDGMNVYGRKVLFRKGRVPHLPAGRNTEVSKDGLTLTAAIDGCIEYKNALISISDMFIVRGDVDAASGNIDSLGTVVVQGDVRDGFSVRASGDINVRGMVEGAKLEAGGNIAIAFGMNGMNHGTLTAGGNVSAKYLENCTVQCGGDVRADVILNGAVTAGKSILAVGSKGLLVGSRCRAGLAITANNIGSGGSRMEVAVVNEKLNTLLAGREKEGNPEVVRQKLEAEKQREATIGTQIKMISQFAKKDSAPAGTNPLLNTLTAQREQIRSEIGRLEEKLRKLEASGFTGQSVQDFKIVALRVLCMGTKMTIGPFTQTLPVDYSGMKFYADSDNIVSTPIVPSDRIN